MSSASLQDFNYPTEIQIDQQYDAVIVFAEEDARFVIRLVDVLARFVTLKDDSPPRICVLDEMDCLNWIQDRFSQFAEALNRSTSVFVYCTKSLNRDKWAQMQKDAVLTNEMNNNKGNIFPLRGDANPDLFLDRFKGIDVTKILTKNRRLIDVDDVEKLISDDFHPRFLKNIRTYFNRILYHRKEREKRDEEMRRYWRRTNSAPMMQHIAAPVSSPMLQPIVALVSSPMLQPIAAPANRDSSREQLPPELRESRQQMDSDGSRGRNICVVQPLPNLELVCPDRPPSGLNPSPSPDFTPFSSGGFTDFSTPSLTGVLQGLNASSPSINMDVHQDPQNAFYQSEAVHGDQHGDVGSDNAAHQSVGDVSHSSSGPSGGSSIGIIEQPQEEDPDVLFEDGAQDVEIALDALQLIP